MLIRNHAEAVVGDKKERDIANMVGYNFRMTNLQAAVGLAQMEQIDRFIEIKRSIAQRYETILSKIDGIRFMTVKPWAYSTYWMNAIEVQPDTGLDASEVIQLLSQKGIGARPFFVGLHRQPAFIKQNLFTDKYFPSSDYVQKYCLYYFWNYLW